MSLSVHCPGNLRQERDCFKLIDCVHQVFDNTPAAKDATLEAGDELVGINGENVKVVKEQAVPM